MAINKKTGKVVKQKSLTQKLKAAVTRKRNKMLGKKQK